MTITMALVLAALAGPTPFEISGSGVTLTVNAARDHIKICDDNTNPGQRVKVDYKTSYAQTWEVVAPDNGCADDSTFISRIEQIRLCSGVMRISSVVWECQGFERLN
jgi:hypothetical protein